MMMLTKNGTRHPQLRNWSAEIALNNNTAKFARKNPAGAPNCGQDAINPRWAFERAHSIESSTEPPPFAAEPETLDEANDGQDDSAPNADLLVGRDKGHGKGRKAGQQQGRD